MNIQSLLKQAQKMQKDLEAIEKELETREYAATVNRGDVNVLCNGAMQIQSLTIKEELIQEGDKEKIQDLVTTAVNAVLRKAVSDKNEVMKKATGGVKLPGGF